MNVIRTGHAPEASALKRGVPTKGVGAGAGAMSARSATSEEDEKLMEACREFESVFLSILLKESKAVPKAGQFEGVRAGQSAFSDMLADELGKEMARAGGIGLAEVLYNELARVQAAEPALRPGRPLKTDGVGPDGR